MNRRNLRRHPGLGACYLAGWLACVGASARAQDWNQPIPQDPERQTQSAREQQAWSRRTTVEAYDRVGRRDAKWDEPARRALGVVASMEAENRDPIARRWEALVAARQAIAAGCDDPLILQVEGNLSREFVEADTKDSVHRLVRAANLLKTSRYPAVRKIQGLARAAEVVAGDPNATEEERYGSLLHLDEVLRLLPISLAEDGVNPQTEFLWKTALERTWAGHRGLSNDAARSYEWVANQIPAEPALQLAWLHARAESLRHYAWEARGNGMGFTVTEENSRKMEERLGEAKRAIDAAWTLKPGDALTANIAIRVLLGMDGDRAELERWFRRAMLADGNNLKACQDKAYWLEPKWYGSPADLVEFGRLCGDTKNWQARLTLIEPELYLLATSVQGAPPAGDFWQDPEVWTRCRTIFDEFLAHKPDEPVVRSRYAAVAYLTGHHAVAAEQFARVGDDIPVNRNSGLTREWMTKIRAESIARANEAKAAP